MRLKKTTAGQTLQVRFLVDIRMYSRIKDKFIQFERYDFNSLVTQ